MALDILEQDDFKNLKLLLSDETLDETNLMKKGLRKAA